jgi:hypothetical protein
MPVFSLLDSLPVAMHQANQESGNLDEVVDFPPVSNEAKE